MHPLDLPGWPPARLAELSGRRRGPLTSVQARHTRPRNSYAHSPLVRLATRQQICADHQGHREPLTYPDQASFWHSRHRDFVSCRHHLAARSGSVSASAAVPDAALSTRVRKSAEPLPSTKPPPPLPFFFAAPFSAGALLLEGAAAIAACQQQTDA